MSIYKLGEKMLSISVIAEIIAEDKQLALGEKAKQKIQDCRDYLDKKMEQSDSPIYGINTGFGSLCNHKISKKELGKLQKELDYTKGFLKIVKLRNANLIEIKN